MTSPALPLPLRHPGSRLRLALRDAAKATYCQMYYWGRDVLHPGGNLLVRLGFERLPKTTAGGTSRYRQVWRNGLLELHGFCAGWYPARGPGICFDRKHDTWRLWTAPEPPDPGALADRTVDPALHRDDPAALLRLSGVFLGWILTYEREVLRLGGGAARLEHHRDYTRLLSRRRWLPPAASLAWMEAYAADPAAAPRPKAFLTPTPPVRPMVHQG